MHQLVRGVRLFSISLLCIFLVQACADDAELTPFRSDGCSLFPDASLITGDDWCSCCMQHDMAYWRGGTADERRHADEALRACVLDKTNSPALADTMFEGVRLGGSPYFYNWYRWGYGWPYERKYQALTDSEKKQADTLLRDFRESGETVCAF